MSGVGLDAIPGRHIKGA